MVSALNLQRVIIDCFADPRSFPLIVDGLEEGLEHRMTRAAFEQVTLTAATCGPDAALRGVAGLVLETYFTRWFAS